MKTRMLMLFSASALALAGCGGRDEAANTDMANLDANMAAEGNLAIDNAAVAAAPMSAQGFANTAAASDRAEFRTLPSTSRLPGLRRATAAWADPGPATHLPRRQLEVESWQPSRGGTAFQHAGLFVERCRLPHRVRMRIERGVSVSRGT